MTTSFLWVSNDGGSGRVIANCGLVGHVTLELRDGEDVVVHFLSIEDARGFAAALIAAADERETP